jgi:hypothetical protein
MPAKIIFSRISGESDAGPMVQTNFVLLDGKVKASLPVQVSDVGKRTFALWTKNNEKFEPLY